MAKEIVECDLRGGDLFSYQDMILKDRDLIDTGVTTSDEFMLAQTMGGAQVNVVAGTNGCTTGLGENLYVSIDTATESGGTFDNTVFNMQIPENSTFAEGELMASYIPPRELNEMYAKLAITSDHNAVGSQATAYQVGVCKS